jgi:hypothetical protein
MPIQKTAEQHFGLESKKGIPSFWRLMRLIKGDPDSLFVSKIRSSSAIVFCHLSTSEKDETHIRAISVLIELGNYSKFLSFRIFFTRTGVHFA